MVPDLDAVLLRFLVASDIEPDRLKAAFAGVEEHVTRNRFRLEGLLLPWLGLHLRAGDPGSVEALLDRLTAGSEGFDNSAAQAWAAAVPRLATWKDQGLAAKLSERLLAAIDSPSFGSRMTSMRLLGMLAHRYAEAGQPEQAKLLRDRLATRFANVPSAASWIRGPS